MGPLILSTSSLAPRRQRGSPYVFITSKLTMAENSHPTKRHKPTNLSNDTPIENSEPIEDIAKLDAPPSNEAFLESDARKTIDDNLCIITRDLPKSSHLHGLTGSVIMDAAEEIRDTFDRTHAY